MAASMASAAGSSKDDDDEVVQELDVYISKALADNLYLLQYPHRPVGRSYNEDQCVAARVKPKQHKVELEFALNTHDPSYDRLRGEQFAANADGSGDRSADQKPVFKSTMMDRQLLTSTKSTSSAENYAVGILRPGELHLSPLSAIVQMMPSFPHLDQSDKKAKAAEAEEEVDEPKAVTVRFANQETDRAKKAREKSFRFIHQKQESEPWVEATYHNFGSEMSGVERAMLVCPQMDRDESELPKTLQDYFKDLVIENTGTKAPVKSSQELSMHALSRLPIQDQIKAVLMSAKVVDFAKLMSALPPKSDATSVVRFLQQVALLVQGCWVVKSDVLYRKDSFSPKTGVPADTLCRARDFLMFLFTQSRFVTQTKFADTVRLPVIDVKTLLEEMAKPTPDGWEFMLPYDRDFVARYPDVVQRQQMLWDAKQQFLSKSFRLSRQEAQDTLMQSPPAGTKGRQQKRRARSRNDSTASDGSGSDSGLMTNGQDVLSKASGSMLSKAAGPATKLSKASRSSTTSSAKAAH
ncbi:DNA-directed RNA polymerase III subunit RPC5-like [Dermacentor silvarum]|uniref:DNA-directed RNA polymerase III subunit RPC5-like n=1 Tax=Dermacentor silvarum TaxID=543639 RepID=UPI0021019759|nr:DNA-directed RNA polymerase III subunit RPC5-like [Dermacentor silvarum]